MYESSFGLTEAPFSISPDPRYLYMSQRHQEAMAHLRYGIQEAGGFVQLTGEVGTGKTTVCRSMLEQLPDNVDVALILNPQISDNELLATLCDEIGVTYPTDASPKQLLDLLNERLIEAFSQGRRTVLVIDEAQILTRAVLEQIRILTNLETNRQKLLQIILIGQPELNATISRSDLRQLSQRITARYHLEPLTRNETAEYIKYRLAVAGCHRPVFSAAAMRRAYRLSRGVPRVINVICDRALLGAYSNNKDTVPASMVSTAGREVFGRDRSRLRRAWWWISGVTVACALALLVLRPHGVLTELPLFRSVGGGAPSPASEVEAGPREVGTSGELASREVSGPDAKDVSLAVLLDEEDFARSETEALYQLLNAWGLSHDADTGVSCASIEASFGLRCLRERGTWGDLRTFNRVAALPLRHQGQPAYVLLTAIGGGGVTISSRRGVYRIARSQVAPHWTGEYLLLWRAPPEGTGTIAEHSEGVDVLWLRQTLNRVPSLEPTDIDNAYFDALLKEKIMAFQKSNNLQVDGKAGAHTIILLNSIVDPDVPKLKPLSAG